MDNLRLLIIRDVIPNGLNHVPDELRYFPKKNLVSFNLETGQIKYLWEGVKVILFFNCLSIIYNFSSPEGVRSFNTLPVYLSFLLSFNNFSLVLRSYLSY
jgi:hypothetical protein